MFKLVHKKYIYVCIDIPIFSLVFPNMRVGSSSMPLNIEFVSIASSSLPPPPPPPPPPRKRCPPEKPAVSLLSSSSSSSSNTFPVDHADFGFLFLLHSILLLLLLLLLFVVNDALSSHRLVEIYQSHSFLHHPHR